VADEGTPWTPEAGTAVLVDGTREAVVLHVGATPVGWTKYRNERGRETGALLLDPAPLAYVQFKGDCGVCGSGPGCSFAARADQCPYSRPSGVQTGNVAADRLTPRG
jgi:hypothetical protein